MCVSIRTKHKIVNLDSLLTENQINDINASYDQQIPHATKKCIIATFAIDDMGNTPAYYSFYLECIRLIEVDYNGTPYQYLNYRNNNFKLTVTYASEATQTLFAWYFAKYWIEIANIFITYK